MKRLALYPKGLPLAAVNEATPMAYSSDCTLCPLHEGARNVCLPAEGERGGILVVGERPTKLEDTAGRVFYGQASRRVRDMIKAKSKEPVMYDNAIRCATTALKLSDKWFAACRSYTSYSLRRSRPKRIICLGTEAALSVLGRRLHTMQVRRGYGWAQTKDGPVPVFVLPSPRMAFQNSFAAKAFASDLEWALTAQVHPWFVNAVTYLVRDKADARKAAKRLMKHEWYSYDVETFGRMHNTNFRVESATFLADTADRSYTWTREALANPGAREVLKQLLANRKLRAVTQNGKYDDRSMLCELGVAPEILYDTRLGRKLLEPEASAALGHLAETVGMGGHKKEADTKNKLIKRELNRLANPPSEFTPKGNRRKIKPPAFPVDDRVLHEIREGIEADAFMFGYLDPVTLYRYNARDVWSTREVAIQDMHRLDEHPTISRAWNLVVKHANKAVRKIEHWGFPVDRDAVEHLAAYCDKGIADLDEKMREYTDINPDSTKQLGEFLYEELDLPCSKTTPSGARSTDEEALEELKDKHPYVNFLLERRKLRKFASTYARGMLVHICDDGRIHPSFLLDGAGTGRLSCQDPNLQNIPRAKGSVLGTMARNCFVSSHPDWELLELDFSQLELRVAAMLSGDEEMIKDFKNGIDIHSNGATLCCEVVWKIPRAKWDKMTADERDPYRSQIKTTIFGKLYGKTDAGLAAEFGCHISVIAQINRTIWGRYKKLAKFMEQCIRESQQTGVTWTWWDGGRSRVRPIWGIADQDEKRRKHYARTAGNTPVQGSAAEFMTASLWPIIEWIEEDAVPAEVVATVHDSVMFNVHKSATLEVAYHADRIMRGHNSLGVPLKTDAKRGPAWGSMKNLEAA